MTVKEWKEELDCYDDDAEVIFEFDDDVEVDSWTENRWGDKEVHINQNLEETFCAERHGDCYITLGVVTE